jgi:hypothetical protein
MICEEQDMGGGGAASEEWQQRVAEREIDKVSAEDDHQTGGQGRWEGGGCVGEGVWPMTPFTQQGSASDWRRIGQGPLSPSPRASKKNEHESPLYIAIGSGQDWSPHRVVIPQALIQRPAALFQRGGHLLQL